MAKSKKATLPGCGKVKKPRKRRKPMSAEQKAKAAERLAAAREKRQKANPPSYANVHESVKALDDDHPVSRKNVMEWIKINKEQLKELRAAARRKEKGAEARLSSIAGYVRNMEKYLRDGDWVDIFYGKDQENVVGRRCKALAYHWYGPNKGMPKRDVGTFYPDIAVIWERDMYEQEGYVGYSGENYVPIESTKKTRKTRKKKDEPSSKTDKVLSENIKKLAK